MWLLLQLKHQISKFDGARSRTPSPKTLIKEIFQEEFKKQAENITNLISGNLKLAMQEIHWLKNEVSYLRKSLRFTQNKLEEKVGNVEKRMEKLDSDIQEICEYQTDPKYVQHKLT